VAISTLPKEANKGEEYHVIVGRTDAGFPALTRYRRLIVTIK
tara:strand:+ start:492 stop:617 length:126 start_codon:yes stop_codon:yes gene_type:complete